MKVRFAVVLAGFAIAAAAVGCADSRFPREQSETLICGFESYEELVNMRFLNYFGAVYQTPDAVTEGSVALRVEAKGDYTRVDPPTLVMDTSIMNRRADREELGFVTKYDYSDTSAFLLDVYNGGEEERRIWLQLQTESQPYNRFTTPVSAVIPAKTAMTCEFPLDRGFVSRYCNLKRVTQIRLLFENEEQYMQPRRVLYIDNFRAVTTESAPAASTVMRKEGELEAADWAEYLGEWELTGEDGDFYRPCTLTYSPFFKAAGAGCFRIANAFQTGYWHEGNPDHSEGISYLGEISGSRSVRMSLYNDYAEPITGSAVLNGRTYAFTLPPREWVEQEVSDSEPIASFALEFQLTGKAPANVYIDEIYFV